MIRKRNEYRIVRARWLVGFATLFLLSAGQLQNACSTVIDAPVQFTEELRRNLIDAVEYESELKQLPAVAIAIVDMQANPDVVLRWSFTHGHRDLESKHPATSTTVFRVGSVSKLFTDIAVMQLVESGTVDLDASITQWLPEFGPSNSSDGTISLRRLMSHQAGLVREPPIGHYFDDGEPSLVETVTSLNETSCVYPPGTKTKYSNAGIAVVGRVLEKIHNRPFEQIIEEQILKPVGMNNSTFEKRLIAPEDQALGFMWTHDGRRFPAPEFAFGMSPAANLYSTVDDLADFATVILNPELVGKPRLLKRETLAAMTQPTRYLNGKPGRFGIGFHVDRLDEHRRIGHGGAVYGHATQFELLPDQGLAAIVTISLDGANAVASRLANHALRLMLASRNGGVAPKYQQTDSIPLSRARQIRGLYKNGESSLRIWNYGDRLWIRRGSSINELRARNDELIVDDVSGYGLKIKRTADGQLQVGDLLYKRQQDELPKDIDGEWGRLIGEFGWDFNTLYILEREGKLHALIEWFYCYPLTKTGENEYAFPDYGLYHGEKILFDCDADGVARTATAAGIAFERREVGTRNGETFRIDPIRPIKELRITAADAKPPTENGHFRKPNLIDVTQVDETIKLDIRYATTNNFMNAVFYESPRAFMQRPAAEALARVHQRLAGDGLGLLIHDAYRPWYVTKMFWDATPSSMKDFVANPANGSRHNRGCAVDLTLYDRATGKAVETVAGYDEFSNRSFPQYPGGTSRQRWYRRKLREVMEAEQFTIYEYEWWHFDFHLWQEYPILNKTFEQLER